MLVPVGPQAWVWEDQEQGQGQGGGECLQGWGQAVVWARGQGMQSPRGLPSASARRGSGTTPMWRWRERERVLLLVELCDPAPHVCRIVGSPTGVQTSDNKWSYFCAL